MKHKRQADRNKSIDELVDHWTRGSRTDLDLAAIRDLIRFLDKELYSQYEPFVQKAPFWERFAGWVQNVTKEAEQQALFRLVPWLLFVGKSELNMMYESAFRGPITRWLIETAGLDICDPSLRDHLAGEIRHTWFGSLAGMDLGSFMRINGIEEQSLRPDFGVLSELADTHKIAEYMAGKSHVNDASSPRYRRIVIVEDFVGTGTQMKAAIRCLQNMQGTPVLICPMISADEGCQAGRKITAQYPHIQFEEYHRISSSARLQSNNSLLNVEGEVMPVHSIIEQTWERLRGSDSYDEPYGFKNHGILLLTYLNCPNNVPPMLHREVKDTGPSGGWMPLFPRANREV